MNVTTLIFLGLAVVWAIVLLPEFIRKVASGRHSDTIRSFNHQLSVLDRSGPDDRARANVIDLRSRAGGQRRRSSVAAQPVPMSVRKRRQEVLTVLGAAAVLTLLCTVAFGGLFLVLHIVADILLVTYLVLLAQVNQAAAAPTAAPVSALRPATVGRATPAPRRIAN
jgi:hypothetical protein